MNEDTVSKIVMYGVTAIIVALLTLSTIYLMYMVFGVFLLIQH